MSAEPWRRSGTLVDIEDRNGQKNSCRFWTPFPYTRRSFNDAFYTHFRILVTIISIESMQANLFVGELMLPVDSL